MTVFKFPTPPYCPVYDVKGDKWVPKLLFWECVSYPSEPKLPFYELLATYGPLSTLEFDVGDKITADQVFDLPMYSAVIPENAIANYTYVRISGGVMNWFTICGTPNDLKFLEQDSFIIKHLGE